MVAFEKVVEGLYQGEGEDQKAVEDTSEGRRARDPLAPLPVVLNIDL